MEYPRYVRGISVKYTLFIHGIALVCPCSIRSVSVMCPCYVRDVSMMFPYGNCGVCKSSTKDTHWVVKSVYPSDVQGMGKFLTENDLPFDNWIRYSRE